MEGPGAEGADGEGAEGGRRWGVQVAEVRMEDEDAAKGFPSLFFHRRLASTPSVVVSDTRCGHQVYLYGTDRMKFSCL